MYLTKKTKQGSEGNLRYLDVFPYTVCTLLSGRLRFS